jgi:Flp pilus assembly protein TadG
MEMAIASPLFFLLMFGIAEFGRALWQYGSMSHGAREAARYAVVRGAESGRAATAQEVQDYVRTVVGLSNSTVTTTWQPDNEPGSVVQVLVQDTFVPAMGFVPSFSLSARSEMVITF